MTVIEPSLTIATQLRRMKKKRNRSNVLQELVDNNTDDIRQKTEEMGLKKLTELQRKKKMKMKREDRNSRK